jgi:hypothetical protein
MSRNQEISQQVDALIAERDAGRASAQIEIDTLMNELEALVTSSPAYQQQQAEYAWKRACINNILWNN